MRYALIAAASALVLAGGLSGAVAAAPASAAVIQDVTDAELAKYAAAEEGVRAVTAQVQGGTPTTEQQAAMVAAIEAAGMDLERFNAISSSVSTDARLAARLAVARAPESPAGSVGATATDAELGQFAAAMAAVRPIAEALNGAAPDAEQQTAMAEAIASSGLEIERFNAISAALASDPRLQARVALAEAQRQG